jgi:hypothetical protein
LELTERLDRVLDDIQASLPEGMQIHRHIFRQSIRGSSMGNGLQPLE